jgi:prepilin-type N-terminal cleavage/methylation domain-containing protein
MKKLSNLISKVSSQAGFTMIELLVVIAVIGVLAVAVLSSINPIEQINKGRDTRKRSNAAQLINAIDRFYAINEMYPWNDATYATQLTSGDTLPSEAFPDDAACADDGNGFCVIGGPTFTLPAEYWLDGLSDTDEVKLSYINQITDDSSTNVIYVAKADGTIAGVDDSVYVCFSPASKQFQQEAVDGCLNRQDILPSGACPQASYDATTEWSSDLICLP